MGQPTVEQFDFGITRQWLDERQIVLIRTAGHMNRPAIDTWANVLIDTINLFPATQPIAICQDLTGPSQGFNAEIRNRLAPIYDHMPKDRPIYSAIALSNSGVRNMVNVYLRRRKFQPDNLQEQVFDNVETSIHWLRQHLYRDTASV